MIPEDRDMAVFDHLQFLPADRVVLEYFAFSPVAEEKALMGDQQVYAERHSLIDGFLRRDKRRGNAPHDRFRIPEQQIVDRVFHIDRRIRQEIDNLSDGSPHISTHSFPYHSIM